MTPKWHKLGLNCPKCSAEPAIMEILSSSDGEILFCMVCAVCGIELQWLTTGTKLAMAALCADIEEAQAKKEPRPVKPPLKLLPPPDVKIADHKFLHDCGIEDV